MMKSKLISHSMIRSILNQIRLYIFLIHSRCAHLKILSEIHRWNFPKWEISSIPVRWSFGDVPGFVCGIRGMKNKNHFGLVSARTVVSWPRGSFRFQITYERLNVSELRVLCFDFLSLLNVCVRVFCYCESSTLKQFIIRNWLSVFWFQTCAQMTCCLLSGKSLGSSLNLYTYLIQINNLLIVNFINECALIRLSKRAHCYFMFFFYFVKK